MEHVVSDYLSKLRLKEPENKIPESFPDQQLFAIFEKPWYANIVNYLTTKDIPNDCSKMDRNKFMSKSSTMSG